MGLQVGLRRILHGSGLAIGEAPTRLTRACQFEDIMTSYREYGLETKGCPSFAKDQAPHRPNASSLESTRDHSIHSRHVTQVTTRATATCSRTANGVDHYVMLPRSYAGPIEASTQPPTLSLERLSPSPKAGSHFTA